ncbi:uncharacterized protein NFIA_026120 [Aspergillus fischeri NRRL 181]|uniref:Uncharacterized protein n=1 Tax=Neosartorya fischeri (strain ATCC 1020 / DSM 3700 / CBS 544.65 / FGSC A1164 / JCM 1740 / NRRL 181 / WB 181) TaxID=331117 RepID=A1DCH8_NEOFI|nr:uncharacterized protein NFIA_026120 [Aspergillus fischeri NRRL 181]EAW19538.1 hypothetical protein NFIA_026120 [Aspergillus fischeri NRRL 181]
MADIVPVDIRCVIHNPVLSNPDCLAILSSVTTLCLDPSFMQSDTLLLRGGEAA